LLTCKVFPPQSTHRLAKLYQSADPYQVVLRKNEDNKGSIPVPIGEVEGLSAFFPCLSGYDDPVNEISSQPLVLTLLK